MLNEELSGHQETELDKGCEREEGVEANSRRRELARTTARVIIFAAGNVIYSHLFAPSDI